MIHPAETEGVAAASGHTPPAEDIFISPRVVDHGAFTEYVASLKGLIQEAGSRSDRLKHARAEVDTMVESVEGVSKKLKERLDTSVRLVPTIDQRLKKAEELVSRAVDTADHREALETELNDAAESIIGGLRERVGNALDQMGQRLADGEEAAKRTESRLADTLKRLEAAEARLAETESRLRAAEDAAGTAELRAAAAADRVDSAVGRLGEADATVTSIAERLERSLDSTTASVEELEQRAHAMVDELTKTADAAGARAKEARLMVAKLDKIVGREGDESGDSLRGAVAAAEQHRAEIAGTASELESLCEQSEQARNILADSLLEAVEKIDRLESRRSELVQAIESAIAHAESGRPGLEAWLADAARQLAEIENKAGDLADLQKIGTDLVTKTEKQLRTKVDALGAKLESTVRTHADRMEHAGTWLGQITQRAERAGIALEQLLASAEQQAPPAADTEES